MPVITNIHCGTDTEYNGFFLNEYQNEYNSTEIVNQWQQKNESISGSQAHNHSETDIIADITRNGIENDEIAHINNTTLEVIPPSLFNPNQHGPIWSV
jgi:hypothetical protein